MNQFLKDLFSRKSLVLIATLVLFGLALTHKWYRKGIHTVHHHEKQALTVLISVAVIVFVVWLIVKMWHKSKWLLLLLAVAVIAWSPYFTKTFHSVLPTLREGGKAAFVAVVYVVVVTVLAYVSWSLVIRDNLRLPWRKPPSGSPFDSTMQQLSTVTSTTTSVPPTGSASSTTKAAVSNSHQRASHWLKPNLGRRVMWAAGVVLAVYGLNKAVSTSVHVPSWLPWFTAIVLVIVALLWHRDSHSHNSTK